MDDNQFRIQSPVNKAEAEASIKDAVEAETEVTVLIKPNMKKTTRRRGTRVNQREERETIMTEMIVKTGIEIEETRTARRTINVRRIVTHMIVTNAETKKEIGTETMTERGTKSVDVTRKKTADVTRIRIVDVTRTKGNLPTTTMTAKVEIRGIDEQYRNIAKKRLTKV